MDIRAFIFGILGGIALVASTYLFAIGEDDGAKLTIAFAGTAAGYLVGLYSSPYDGDAE